MTEIFHKTLADYWGYTGFRPLQEEIIGSVFSGKDTLGLMPTGGGKSLTFQVPALIMEGLCIVITPLIALMLDQVENLKKRNIKAIAIHSGMSTAEIDTALDNCIFGDFKFLYLSPERLASEVFIARLPKMKVCLITVDEAHCISQWGYDFRPSYLRIAELRKYLPQIPVLALTATATPDVVEDIMHKLAFREKNVLRKSFERKNLAYIVVKTEDKLNYIEKIIRQNPGTGIIYVRNRRKTSDIAIYLKKKGLSVDFYHAGLNHDIRRQRQSAWQEGKTGIIVATNAFGMGIDKADVRYVIHIDLPDSPEAYFQEAGRAGRDEKDARAILLFNNADRKIAEERITTTFPAIAEVKKVYHSLGNFLQVPIGGGKNQSYDFILSDFLSRYKINALTAHNSLQILQREGYIELSDEINTPSLIHFDILRDDLYRFQVANAQFDGFIKLLLRSYTGIFSGYVPIDEHLLAKRSALKVNDIYKYLNRLKNMGIIKYIPRKKNPVIIFSEERIDNSNLYFSPQNYKILKEKFIERINKVLYYASSENICRSRILLAYFGEENVKDCGQCDVCMKRNSEEISTVEFDSLVDQIKTVMKDQSCDIRKIISRINAPEKKLMKVFRFLLDQGIIIKENNIHYKLKN